MGDYSSYKKHSNQLYELLLEYTDKIERFSSCFAKSPIVLIPSCSNFGILFLPTINNSEIGSVQHSNQLYELLLEYTDKIERFSIDECFMDMTLFLLPNETLLNT